MRFVIDLDSLELIAAANDRNAVVQVQGKRGDNSPFEVIFVRSGVAEELATSSVLTFGAKEAGKYDGTAVILDASFSKSGTGTAAKYLATPSFNTTALNALFLIDANTSNDPAYIDLMAEFTWQVGAGAPTSTKTFSLRVHNDVLRDGEATPTPATAAVSPPSNAGMVVITGTLSPDATGALLRCNPTVDFDPIWTSDESTTIAPTGEWIRYAYEPSAEEWGLVLYFDGVLAGSWISYSGGLDPNRTVPPLDGGGSTGTATAAYTPDTPGALGQMTVSDGYLYVVCSNPGGVPKWKRIALETIAIL